MITQPYCCMVKYLTPFFSIILAFNLSKIALSFSNNCSLLIVFCVLLRNLCNNSLVVIGLRIKYLLTSSSVRTELPVDKAGDDADIESDVFDSLEGDVVCLFAAAAAAMTDAVLADFVVRFAFDVDEEDEDSSWLATPPGVCGLFFFTFVPFARLSVAFRFNVFDVSNAEAPAT